jgi:hypothetical protein
VKTVKRFLGSLCPSKSGLMNKHIVKHIVKHTVKTVNKHIVKHIMIHFWVPCTETYIVGCECNAVASYLGFETFCGSLRGQYLIFGCPVPV